MDIVALLGNIPWMTVGSAALTFIVGFLAKQSIYAKAIDTLGDVADMASDYVKAQADGKITAEEAQELLNDIKHIVSDYARK